MGYGARGPAEMVARTNSKQHAHGFPFSKTNIDEIPESKQNPSFQAVQTALAERKHKNGAKINTQIKWKLP